jgi:hypothetical protein
LRRSPRTVSGRGYFTLVDEVAGISATTTLMMSPDRSWLVTDQHVVAKALPFASTGETAALRFYAASGGRPATERILHISVVARRSNTIHSNVAVP